MITTRAVDGSSDTFRSRPSDGPLFPNNREIIVLFFHTGGKLHDFIHSSSVKILHWFFIALKNVGKPPTGSDAHAASPAAVARQ
jgi:hypothetical protein